MRRSVLVACCAIMLLNTDVVLASGNEFHITGNGYIEGSEAVEEEGGSGQKPPPDESSGKNDALPTGDESRVRTYIIILILCSSVIGYIIFSKRKDLANR